jgi:hypothetical protein
MDNDEECLTCLGNPNQEGIPVTTVDPLDRHADRDTAA